MKRGDLESGLAEIYVPARLNCRAQKRGCVPVHTLGHADRGGLSPGGSAERVFLYYAEVDESQPKEAGGGEDSETEDIELVERSFEEAWEMLGTGQIVDAKALIGLQWLKLKLA